MIKSLSLILGISILIHLALSFSNLKSDKSVVAKLDKIADSEVYTLGYEEGYHRATEDLSNLNSTPEQH